MRGRALFLMGLILALLILSGCPKGGGDRRDRPSRGRSYELPMQQLPMLPR